MDNHSAFLLKKQVIEYWKQSPANRPVRVVRAIQEPEFWVSGYFTSYKFISGRSLTDVERILGFEAGYLQAGAYLYEFCRLPCAEEFELRGYSQCPDGKPWSASSSSKYPVGAGAPQWELKRALYIPARLLAVIESNGAVPKIA
ncbi:MAG: hypothetical protein RR726_17640 [Pseudomonas sp.]